MNTSGWRQDLESDYKIAKEILNEMNRVTPEYDSKMKDLKNIITEKIRHPINDNNKKIIIFTAFADTANYLYDNISTWAKETHDLESARITRFKTRIGVP